MKLPTSSSAVLLAAALAVSSSNPSLAAPTPVEAATEDGLTASNSNQHIHSRRASAAFSPREENVQAGNQGMLLIFSTTLP
jgi:hypothetical protein